MIRFKYKAINDKGDLVQDEIEAASKEDVASDLNLKGCTPVSISEKLALPDFSQIFNAAELGGVFNRVKTRETTLFFRQLAALFTAGVPIFEALTALEEQFTKEKIRDVIVKLKEDVSAGASFSGALARHPRVFSHLIVAMVGAGERSGSMDDVLRRIAAFLEKENQLRQKLQGALRYPATVMVVLTLAFVFAIMAIIPKFTNIFASFKTKLPLPTRILLGINYALAHYWWLILIVLGVGYAFLKLYRGTSNGQRQWDQLLLKLPVFGLLLTKISLARFFAMLSSMISSGISIVNGLEITASTADNAVISGAIMKIRERVMSGVALSEAMKEYVFFPPTSIHMVAVGEKSGSLDEMLMKSAGYFDEESDYTIANLMNLLEPILIFVMGMFVLLLALGIFMPMWGMMSLYAK